MDEERKVAGDVPQRETLVNRELDVTFKEIEVLEMAISTLIERLEPVLGLSQVEPTANDGAVEALPKLAERIRDIRFKITKFKLTLIDVRERLEI